MCSQPGSVVVRDIDGELLKLATWQGYAALTGDVITQDPNRFRVRRSLALNTRKGFEALRLARNGFEAG